MKKHYIWMLGAALCAVGAQAQETSPVQIGETGYNSLMEAWAAVADGDVILLNESQVIKGGRLNVEGMTVTIKGAGENVSISRGDTYNQLMILAKTGSTLNLENLTFDGTSMTQNTIEAQKSANINFTGVNFSNYNRGAVMIQGGGNVTINNMLSTDCEIANTTGLIQQKGTAMSVSGMIKGSFYLDSSNGRFTASNLDEASELTLNFNPSTHTQTFLVSGTNLNADNFICGAEGYYLMSRTSGKDPGIHYARPVVINETTGAMYGDLISAWDAAETDNVLVLKESVAITGNRLQGNGRAITVKGDGEGIVISRGNNTGVMMFLANKQDENSSHLTFENVTIDGTGMTNFAIECGNNSGSSVTFNNAKIANFEGINYVVRARSAVNLNSVVAENCSCAQGVIEANEGKVTFTGDNTIDVYLCKGRTLAANDLTGGLITVNAPEDFGGEGTVVVSGCTDKDYFELGANLSEMKLAVNDNNLVLTDATGIQGVEAEAAEAPVEYFNLQGVKVANPEGGLYIRKQGNKVEKIVVR